MKIDGHYDREADIAWVRFETYDPSTAVAEQTEAGLRELDANSGEIVGLELWRASLTLAADFLAMLPPPQVEIAANRDLCEHDAMALAVEAQHRTRPPRR
jgi:uncharacterized protein YuzE